MCHDKLENYKLHTERDRKDIYREVLFKRRLISVSSPINSKLFSSAFELFLFFNKIAKSFWNKFIFTFYLYITIFHHFIQEFLPIDSCF